MKSLIRFFCFQGKVRGRKKSAAAVESGADVKAKQKESEDKLAEKKALEEKLGQVKIGATVTHKKFGEGVVTWIDGAKKHIRIKFAAGEKQFVFPDAFIMKFLEIK